MPHYQEIQFSQTSQQTKTTMNNVFVNCILLRNRVFSGLKVDAQALMIG